MKNIFNKIFSEKNKKIVIVGIGNTLKGDDAFGPSLVGRLKNEKIRAICIDVGTSPENYADKIIKEKPDIVLFVDAASIDLKPGEYRLLRPDEILKSGFTTHDMSPGMFIEYLKKMTNAEIFLLGVQPENISFGSEMSKPVKKTLEDVLKTFKELCTKHT